MNRISELRTILNKTFHWNKARLDCFSRMLLALFVAKSVNLKKIASVFSSDAQSASKYKRIQRFFWQFKWDYNQLAQFVFSLFFSQQKKVYLIIDRTNWFWGKSKINFFVLAVKYEGIAIPLFWQLLPKAGSSNFTEQKALLERFIHLFGKDCIAGVLADREFANGNLFCWFNQQKIAFYIRLKEDCNAWVYKRYCKLHQLFSQLKIKQQVVYPNYVDVFGQRCRLTGSRSEKGELMIVATNADADHAIYIYLQRWEIENLFQVLKGRGFQLEDTRLTNLERLEKLMALLVIGLSWAHKVGEWRSKVKPIFWKRFCQQRRPEYTFFRYGLDFIQETILTISAKASRTFRKILLFLDIRAFQENCL